jgi:hypothetical protein
LQYRFELKDLNKYYKGLASKDLSWRFRTSCRGKQVPAFEPRAKRLFANSYQHKLIKALRDSDWHRSPLCQHFMQNGVRKHEDPTIFSHVELKYLQSSLHSMITKTNEQEFNETEGKEIIHVNFKKTMKTLEVLMNQVNMQCYFDRLKAFFGDSKPDMSQLDKLITRCLKLYLMIDNFFTIFKMIALKEKIEFKLEARPGNQRLLEMNQTMRARLLVAMKLLLQENPVLPTSFKYKGQCLIAKYEREQAAELEELER